MYLQLKNPPCILSQLIEQVFKSADPQSELKRVAEEYQGQYPFAVEKVTYLYGAAKPDNAFSTMVAADTTYNGCIGLAADYLIAHSQSVAEWKIREAALGSIQPIPPALGERIVAYEYRTKDRDKFAAEADIVITRISFETLLKVVAYEVSKKQLEHQDALDAFEELLRTGGRNPEYGHSRC